ncbi:Protein PHYLLO, chloroplastic isoform C [Glycine soja]|uniref:Protein PHYLLO, chloroplastic isoform C n=1 Tax=Glycine soja TaxID=3848 RepID=A0A445LWS2_GLYSO|nr:Protein PHYLLO, chloroplastic isoform C [Glycine soja]
MNLAVSALGGWRVCNGAMFLLEGGGNGLGMGSGRVCSRSRSEVSGVRVGVRLDGPVPLKDDVLEKEVVFEQCVTRTLSPALTLEEGLEKLKEALQILNSPSPSSPTGFLRFQVALPPSPKTFTLFCSQPHSSSVFPLIYVSKNDADSKSLYVNLDDNVSHQKESRSQIELDELESVSILSMTLAWDEFSFSTFQEAHYSLQVSLDQCSCCLCNGAGTIIGNEDINSIRWPGSAWRRLKDTLYLENIEERETGGTPPIIQTVRAWDLLEVIQIDKLRYQDVLSKGFRSAADKVDTADSDCWEFRSQLKSMKGYIILGEHRGKGNWGHASNNPDSESMGPVVQLKSTPKEKQKMQERDDDTFARYLLGKVKAFIYGLLRYQDVLSKGFRSAADKVDTADSDCWEFRSQLKSMKGYIILGEHRGKGNWGHASNNPDSESMGPVVQLKSTPKEKQKMQERDDDTFARYLLGKVKAFIYGLLRYQDVLSKGFRSAADKVDTADSDCWEFRSQLKSMKGYIILGEHRGKGNWGHASNNPDSESMGPVVQLKSTPKEKQKMQERDDEK